VISRIDILGVPYQVREVSEDSLGKGYAGECDDGTATISIEEGLAPQIARRVLLHEIVHAIEIALGLRMKEEQVMAIGAALNGIPQLRIGDET